MNVAELDIVLINDSKNKKHLVQIKTLDPLAGVMCDDNKRDKQLAKHVELEFADIVANFGSKPHYGMTFGIALEFVRSQIDMEPWHCVRYFKKYSDAEKNIISRSLLRTTKILMDAGVFQKETPIALHLKEPKGPYAGTYQIYKTKEGEDPHPDVITLRVKDFGELDYVIYHECGHGVWERMMDNDIKARWIELFYHNISLITDFNEKLKTMREELCKAGAIKDYLSDLTEEDGDLLRHVLTHIKKQWNIKPLHLNILITTGNDLVDIWPKKISAIPQATVLVTEYATTDPSELMCESFAHHFTGKELPKSVAKLVKQTVEACRYGSNHKGKLD